MPTASAAKLEKQGSLDANDPLRQGIVMVDHKIRNLEKRKAKLDGYKDLQKNGKDLNTDQLEAIAKYDAVIQQLEFARELSKHFSGFAADAVKTAKKQARKEAQERAQQDLSRTREILMIQDVLSSMGQDNVRDDFLQGRAKVSLTSEELQHFDDLYIELTPKREEHVHFQDMFQAPAEVLSSLLEGKNKEVVGTTFTALKSKLLEIAKSGYFDNPVPEAEAPAPVVEEPIVEEVAPIPVQVEQPVITGHMNQIPVGVSSHIPQPAPVHIPVVPAQVAPPVVMPVLQHPPQLPPPQQQQVVPEDLRNSTAPPSIETAYFTPSHLRVFQSGPIDFLQENEVDTTEQHIEAAPPIPTMTYTNQSFTPGQQQQQVYGEPPVQSQPPHIPQPQPAEPPQIYHAVNNTEAEVEGGGWDDSTQSAPPPAAAVHEGWEEETHHASAPPAGNIDDWSAQGDTWGNQSQQNNDGFITQGGRGRGGRGGGRGGGGGDRNQKSGGNYNSGGRGGRGGRGGYNREGGGYNREGGNYNNREGGNYNNRGGGNYNNREGGNYNNRDGGNYNNREGGGSYNREGGNYNNREEGGYGNYKDQNSYQNGYQNRGERGGRGRGGAPQGVGGGRGRGGGGRGGSGGGYRGGNSGGGGGYRSQM